MHHVGHVLDSINFGSRACQRLGLAPSQMSESGTTPFPTTPLKPAAAFSLETILSDDHEAVEHPGRSDGQPAASGWDEETIETPVIEGYCVECEGPSFSFAACPLAHSDVLKISLLKYHARHVVMSTAKCVSQHNTEKVPGRDIPSSQSPIQGTRRQRSQMVVQPHPTRNPQTMIIR